jgi:hypothetical protein
MCASIAAVSTSADAPRTEIARATAGVGVPMRPIRSKIAAVMRSDVIRPTSAASMPSDLPRS